MGIYIDPKKGTKEEWLIDNAVIPWMAPEPDYIDSFPVVLVDNGAFTAAAVADTVDELNRFMDPMDTRSKIVFTVSLEKLETVLDSHSLAQLKG